MMWLQPATLTRNSIHNLAHTMRQIIFDKIFDYQNRKTYANGRIHQKKHITSVGRKPRKSAYQFISVVNSILQHHRSQACCQTDQQT